MFKLTLCVGVPNHKSQEFSIFLAVSLAKSLWVQETPKSEILSIYIKIAVWRAKIISIYIKLALRGAKIISI